MPYHLWLSSEGGGVGYFMTDKFYECLMIYLLKQRYKYGVKTKYFCTKWHAWCWRKRSKLLEIIHLIITLPVCCAKFLKIQNMYLHLSVWPPPSHVWLLLYSSASFSSFNTDSTERVNPTKKKKKSTKTRPQSKQQKRIAEKCHQKLRCCTEEDNAIIQAFCTLHYWWQGWHFIINIQKYGSN